MLQCLTVSARQRSRPHTLPRWRHSAPLAMPPSASQHTRLPTESSAPPCKTQSAAQQCRQPTRQFMRTSAPPCILMSVTMLAMESRSVPLSPSSSASKWQSMFLKPTPAGNVTLYQRKDATKFLSKFRSRSVSTFLSKTAAAFLFGVLLLFLWRNAKLCQGDIASLSRSRGQG